MKANGNCNGRCTIAKKTRFACTSLYSLRYHSRWNQNHLVLRLSHLLLNQEQLMPVCYSFKLLAGPDDMIKEQRYIDLYVFGFVIISQKL